MAQERMPNSVPGHKKRQRQNLRANKNFTLLSKRFLYKTSERLVKKVSTVVPSARIAEEPPLMVTQPTQVDDRPDSSIGRVKQNDRASY